MTPHPTPALGFDPAHDHPDRLADSDEALLDELDSLVDKAVRGDTRAVGAIAIAFGPTLLEEAHAVLGPDHSHLAGDVLQDLFLALCDRTLTFPDIRGAALPWLRRMVRSRAHEQLRVQQGTSVPPDEAAE
jgi:DNA-directed RNA polymerase specialized sigma24 family protein